MDLLWKFSHTGACIFIIHTHKHTVKCNCIEHVDIYGNTCLFHTNQSHNMFMVNNFCRIIIQRVLLKP